MQAFLTATPSASPLDSTYRVLKRSIFTYAARAASVDGGAVIAGSALQVKTSDRTGTAKMLFVLSYRNERKVALSDEGIAALQRLWERSIVPIASR